MKSLQISPSYKPAFVYGGPTISVGRLCEALMRQNQKVSVFTTTANGKMELPSQVAMLDGVQVTYYQRWTGDNSHFSPSLLWNIFRRCKNFEVIHIHSWWNLVSIPAVFLIWFKGVTPILSPRGMLGAYTFEKSKLKRFFHRLIGKWLLSKTILHATSQYELTELLALIPGCRYFILPNIIELPEIGSYSETIRNNDHCKMIFMSRIHPKKGLEILLEVLSNLDFSWQLQIVGSGEECYLELLKKLAYDYRISEKISWLGWKGGTEKFQLLADADLFVLPSLNENFANVVLESLAVGTPVVISDQVGLHDYVSAKNLGWVVPLDKEAWVQALQAAWEAHSLREQIRVQAPALIHEDFGAEQLAKQYLAAYQQFFPQKS